MTPPGTVGEAIEWSVASRAVAGQAISGDLHVVAATQDGALAVVIDGLGHGDEATAAARAAMQTIEQHPNEALPALVERCHQALRQTRGVVMTLVSFNGRTHTATALGIGNVETVLFRANGGPAPKKEHVLLRGGVVGYQLPALQTESMPVTRGDVVVFATDGVREDFSEAVNPAEPLPQLVERIIAQKLRGTDDGLVLACRYLGKA